MFYNNHCPIETFIDALFKETWSRTRCCQYKHGWDISRVINEHEWGWHRGRDLYFLLDDMTTFLSIVTINIGPLSLMKDRQEICLKTNVFWECPQLAKHSTFFLKVFCNSRYTWANFWCLGQKNDLIADLHNFQNKQLRRYAEHISNNLVKVAQIFWKLSWYVFCDLHSRCYRRYLNQCAMAGGLVWVGEAGPGEAAVV